VGYKKCVGDHRFASRDLGAGLQRLECEICGSVVIDLDAAEDGRSPVTVPGLFQQARPTIFSELRREAYEEPGEEAPAANQAPERRPTYTFGPPLRRPQ
jgi:hypothetical protein